MSQMKRLFTIGLLAALATLLSATMSAGAQAETILSVAAPDWWADAITDDVITEFEAQNPGVRVILERISETVPPVGFVSIEEQLDAAAEYYTQADVFLIDQGGLSPFITQAGYVLDLAPLAAVDTTLNPAEYVPAVWDAYQWDNGFWALPASYDVMVMVYAPEKFDAAGLPYPTAEWTLTDYANAARALSVTNDAGVIEVAGLTSFSSEYLLHSVLPVAPVDTTVVPNQPTLTDPAVVDLMTQWQDLNDEGVVGFPPPGPNPLGAMGIFPASFLTFPMQGVETAGTLLPGNQAGIMTRGFAVSGGTVYPELAYELAKFLSQTPEVVNRLMGFPALNGMDRTLDTEGFMILPAEFTPEQQALIDQGIANGIVLSDVNYMRMAVDAVRAGAEAGQPVQASLDMLQLGIANGLEMAATRRGTINVDAPDLPPELAPGETVLKVGIPAYINPLPNLERWEALATEFAASEPEIGFVELDTRLGVQFPFNEYDCWIRFNGNGLLLSTNEALSLNPFFDADPEFDRNDLLPGVAGQISWDDQVIGFPYVLLAGSLAIDTQDFEAAGVPVPQGSWTTDQFLEAVNSLQAVAAENGETVFTPLNSSATHLMTLIAAFGGLPIDYRTTPPSFDFTSLNNVEAMRQVLDLAKNGIINYQQLAMFGGGGGGGIDTGPIYPIAPSPFQSDPRFVAVGPTYQLIGYPLGTDYNAVSFDVVSGHISAQTLQPEACFRFLKSVATSPDLLTGMPAFGVRLDALASSGVASPDQIAFYREFASLLAQPNTVVLPGDFVGQELNFVRYWLHQAFDRYVLEDMPLEPSLVEAQQKVDALLTCTADVDQADFEAFSDCVVGVDPELSFMFGG